MRIAVFHNLPSGGAKRALYEWTRRLAGKHRLDVFSLSSADHSFCDLRPFAERYRIYEFYPRRLYASPLGRLNQFQRWRELNALVQIGRVIANKINAGGYDVVFANPCKFTFIPTFIPYVKIPCVYFLHEPFGITFQRRLERPYLRRNKSSDLLDRFDPLIQLYNSRITGLQGESLRRTKLLLANSRFTSEQMKREFAIEVSICRLGVDSDCFHPQVGIDRNNMLISVGELSPRKGFDFLIESMAYIPSGQRPKLHLACNRIDPDEQAYLQDLADQNGVELQVLSNLTAEELTLKYNLAKLCIYAPVLEPFGLVPLEAMACGTPVVGVREGGVQEIIIHERTGLLVDRDPEKFAGAIRMLLDNPDKRADFGRQARTYVMKEWTWSKSTAVLEEFLTSVV